MIYLEFWLLVLAFAGMVLGGWGICWARANASRSRALWGRRLFVVTLVGLGVSGLVAAGTHADALVSLGLVAGLLMVAMLWENPANRWEPHGSAPRS